MNRLLALLAAALCAACTSSSDVATQIVGSDEPPGFLVVATNARFADSARPTEIKRGLAEDGQSLKITLLLANATSEAQRLNTRVEWLDKDGAPIQGALPVARAATVPALGYASITAVATHPKAASFRISLTEPFAGAAR